MTSLSGLPRPSSIRIPHPSSKGDGRRVRARDEDGAYIG